MREQFDPAERPGDVEPPGKGELQGAFIAAAADTNEALHRARWLSELPREESGALIDQIAAVGREQTSTLPEHMSSLVENLVDNLDDRYETAPAGLREAVLSRARSLGKTGESGDDLVRTHICANWAATSVLPAAIAEIESALAGARQTASLRVTDAVSASRATQLIEPLLYALKVADRVRDLCSRLENPAGIDGASEEMQEWLGSHYTGQKTAEAALALVGAGVEQQSVWKLIGGLLDSLCDPVMPKLDWSLTLEEEERNDGDPEEALAITEQLPFDRESYWASCPVAIEFLINAPIEWAHDSASAARDRVPRTVVEGGDATWIRAQRVCSWTAEVLLPMALADLSEPTVALIAHLNDFGPAPDMHPFLDGLVEAGWPVPSIHTTLRQLPNAARIIRDPDGWAAPFREHEEMVSDPDEALQLNYSMCGRHSALAAAALASRHDQIENLSLELVEDLSR